jgi:chromosomal replication initiation ATPase DnaA
LGSEGFIDRKRSQFFESNKNIEVPESRILAPGSEDIKELVSSICGVSAEDLVKPKKGSFNEPRSVAIYLRRRLRGENLAEICGEYGLKTHSSASSAVERVKGQMINDRGFSKRIDELVQMLNKRQTGDPL